MPIVIQCQFCLEIMLGTIFILVCLSFVKADITLENFVGLINGGSLNWGYLLGQAIENELQRVEGNVSGNCLKQLRLFLDALRVPEEWAIRMVDASSKLQSGILRGNLVDLGNYEECLQIDEEKLSGKYCPVTVDWTKLFEILGANLTSTMVEVQHGRFIKLGGALCAPSACKAEDLRQLFWNLGNGLLEFSEETCQQVDSLPKLTRASYLTIGLLCSIILLGLIVSALDLLFTSRNSKGTQHILVTAFSLSRNLKRLFSPSKPEEQFGFLNGIKAISMMWIVLGHGFLLLLAEIPLQNYADIPMLLQKRYAMVLINATLSVETFLIITGVLLSYSFMKVRSQGVPLNLPAYWLHRYLRLTPALAVLVLIYATLLKHLGTGPLYPKVNVFAEQCEERWWYALLYIQNYFSPGKTCMHHSWYLCVDMQLFVVSPLILWMLRKKPKAGLMLIVSLILASMASCFLITWENKLTVSMAAHPDNRDNLQYFTLYYYPTYTRMSTYLIGIVFGYFMYELKSGAITIKLRREVVWLLWFVSLSTMACCVLLGQDTVLLDTYNILNNSVYNTFVRPAWGLAIAWIILACSLQYGGPVNKFLSLPVFNILARLSYCLYLVHYPYILITYYLTRSPKELSVYNQMVDFWSHYCVSLGLAVVLTLFFESPIITIERYLFQKAHNLEQHDGGVKKNELDKSLNDISS